ncbi:FAD dependent oxidoreductase [Chthoniobacter flavus Ellin428]|uniref:FAD dependent oxidoreductase n=1 Tax=Chthoniobacter flavus Ellin428 TaxID=497964 RepID=B4DA23_9BACT|nr:NAD(P)/FAD-dependent oxidoreductase [Chthoniobacter flavus]EDY16650.1 FAD dependent oxidoreductase [Chthoniobacter flavus Ellin428]TCO87225.1 phytoene dehydrogenase-like protein [Chthoniobacter flavus]
MNSVTVGSGPNGLAAAITLAQAGWEARVLEAQPTLGGGARSMELTLPGFVHDHCSAIHPLAIGSPFFRDLPLHVYGLEWVHSKYPLAHPLDDGTAAVLHRSIEQTEAGLKEDGIAYGNLMRPLVAQWEALANEFLQPLLHVSYRPFLMARFGLLALRSAAGLASRCFRQEPARALFAGLAAHSMIPLEAPASAAIALVLGIFGHAVGWPLPRGGASRISEALAEHLRALGGAIETGRKVTSLDHLPKTDAIFLDTSVWQAAELAGKRISPGLRHKLAAFPHGPSIFKIDYALDRRIPWKAPECGDAATVHLGGTLAEIAFAEREVARGRVPVRPFLLLAQPTICDPTRAPAGQHTAWAYCHIPRSNNADMTQAIEAQIERFAPGFGRCILARHISRPQSLQAANASLDGGDISGGACDLWHLLARPSLSANPYRLGRTHLYLCSSSTPPGGGVHGMCGYHAARQALSVLGRG